MLYPFKRTLPIAAAFVLFFVASGLLAQERWFHVRVTETGADPTHVAVNMPLSLIEAALKLVPEQVHQEIDVELNEVDFDLEDLRQFWKDVKDVDDATFVTVESPDETVKVAKEGRSAGGAHHRAHRRRRAGRRALPVRRPRRVVPGHRRARARPGGRGAGAGAVRRRRHRHRRRRRDPGAGSGSTTSTSRRCSVRSGRRRHVSSCSVSPC